MSVNSGAGSRHIVQSEKKFTRGLGRRSPRFRAAQKQEDTMNFSKLLMPIGVAIAAGTGVYLGTAPTTQACMVDSGGGECEHHYCAETCGEGGCGCFRD